jgi:hypothetical protein
MKDRQIETCFIEFQAGGIGEFDNIDDGGQLN